jgi:hypothetical protein
MKKAIAAMTAGLFATAAFAQAPSRTTTPDSSTSPAVAKAVAAHEKQGAKTDAKDAGPEVPQAKEAGKSAAGKKKTKGVRAKIKMPPDNGHASKEDGTAAVTPPTQ